jgi:hypothetical protein
MTSVTENDGATGPHSYWQKNVEIRRYRGCSEVMERNKERGATGRKLNQTIQAALENTQS